MIWLVIALVVALVALSWGAKRKRRGGLASGENPEKSRWRANGKAEYYGGGHHGDGYHGGGAG